MLLSSLTLKDIDLVFLAACHSEQIGRAFLEKGVGHVICVKMNRQVLDQAALTFTKYFYKDILNLKTVCAAFESAKAHVASLLKQSESDLFTLLLPNETHECHMMRNDTGQLICKSEHVQIKEVPKLNKMMDFRVENMQKLIHSLVCGTDLVMVKGPPGVGKSSLVNKTFQYCVERKYFTGGVIIIDLKGASELYNLLRSLKRIIIRSLNLAHGYDREALERADYDQFMEKIISFFEQRENSGLILNNQRFRNKTNKEDTNINKRKFLLGLCNAENILNNSDSAVREDFRNFIE